MTYSQKYTLTHFTSPTEDGLQFPMSAWPLHITLADTFAIDRQTTDIDAKLTALLSQIDAASTRAAENATLGTTPVVLLEKTPSLLVLHLGIISLLEENGAIFNHPEFTKAGFLPHSTVQKDTRLYAGNHIVIDSISLVDMFPNGDWQQRKIITTFALKK